LKCAALVPAGPASQDTHVTPVWGTYRARLTKTVSKWGEKGDYVADLYQFFQSLG